jgi:hypothetical protein
LKLTIVKSAFDFIVKSLEMLGYPRIEELNKMTYDEFNGKELLFAWGFLIAKMDLFDGHLRQLVKERSENEPKNALTPPYPQDTMLLPSIIWKVLS